MMHVRVCVCVNACVRGALRAKPMLKWSLRPRQNPVVDPGGAEGAMPPPQPVKIGQKKDGCQARQLICHVSWPPFSEVSGSDTETPLSAMQKGDLRSNRFVLYW